MAEKLRISSGISELDRLLGGLFIGDKVVWHDDSCSLASPSDKIRCSPYCNPHTFQALRDCRLEEPFKEAGLDA